MNDEKQASLFKRVFGPAYFTLPSGWQQLHDVNDHHVYHGEAEVERGTHWVTKLLASLLRLPPSSVVPVGLYFTRHGEGEIWERRFGDSGFKTYLSEPAVSALPLDEPGTFNLNERFGPLNFTITLRIEEDKVRWDLDSCKFLGISFPGFLVPVSETVEFIDPSTGRYCFDIDLSLFYFGRLIAYRGFVELD